MSLKDTLSLRLLCLKRPQNHNNKCKRASPPKKTLNPRKSMSRALPASRNVLTLHKNYRICYKYAARTLE